MAHKKSAYEPQMRYAKKYIKKIHFDVNIRTEADIIEKLESVPRKATYIKKLIRDDINSQKYKQGSGYKDTAFTR